MSTTALQALLDTAAAATRPVLLVLDENSDGLPRCNHADSCVISNRSDVCSQTEALGWQTEFNDFNIASTIPQQRALYRLSKEKRVVEHVLQALWAGLPTDGELYIAGYKQEGVKTFARRASEAWHTSATLTRAQGQVHLYHFVRPAQPGAALNPDDYHALRPIGSWRDWQVFSKPGLFAWDRFDTGSLFLLAQLPDWLGRRQLATARGLDLGCGHGLLALALLRAGCGQVLATDNNAAALRACAHNLALYRGSATTGVKAADCGDGLAPPFDLILCNPPFHQGFAVEQSLTDRFLQATARLLAADGQALFVVNAFIPLERKAKGLFRHIDVIADDGRYKVLALAR